MLAAICSICCSLCVRALRGFATRESIGRVSAVGLIPTGADDDSLSVTRGIPKSAKV
jgi:hypothetical protein